MINRKEEIKRKNQRKERKLNPKRKIIGKLFKRMR